MQVDINGVPFSEWDYTDITVNESLMLEKLKEKYPNKEFKLIGKCSILADGQEPGHFYGPTVGRCAWDFPSGNYKMTSLDLDETYPGFMIRNNEQLG